MPLPRIWRAIAALPRPFRRTPGRLSRGYHVQEEGLETTLRGYRPTIFALHHGRLGTGRFRFQPFSDVCRFCSLIPGFGVKLSTIILAGPTVLSAVGACPPHDGVRRRWWINVASAVASAVSLIESSQKIGRSHHRHRPGRDIFSRRAAGNSLISVLLVTRQPPSSTS